MDMLLSSTESICPVCLIKLPALITADADGVFLEKNCPHHGPFRTIIWRGSRESYEAWLRDGGPTGKNPPSSYQKKCESSCPFDCGLCPDHKVQTCSAALMVTNKCNLNCPVCFTNASREMLHEPSLTELESMLCFYRDTSGSPFPLELCGGEPTVREDLPQIISMARSLSFTHIQVNSNGILLAEDPGLAHRLKEAGATVIYLNFDGADDGPYLITAGRGMIDIKKRALENCAQAGLAVVLVPVLIPGVNTGQIGRIVEIAKGWIPAVKGINFQPLSYFGTYPNPPRNEDRLTIPEILKMLAEQTGGEIKESDFMPPGCEHPLCSFQALYMLDAKGKLKAITKRQTRMDNDGAAERVRSLTGRQWRANPLRTLTVGGMLFQDAWSVDLMRLQRCIIHIIGRDHRLIPLCAKYITAQDGRRLYPGLV
jgi:uncharacterized radical SAM superfamily Fe-S cluster-containing enzyme